jgi:diacylglycerol kinase (ATP)
MSNKPPPKTGLARISSAFRYSVDGLRAAFNNEAAFRQEFVLFIIFLPILYFLPISPAFKALLFLVNTMVLVVELLNSGIEAIVDLASPDYHDLAKRAKDMGSAAVMTSVFLCLILWGYAILSVM